MNGLESDSQGIVYLCDDDSARRSLVRQQAHQLGLTFDLIVDFHQLSGCSSSSRTGCIVLSDAALDRCEQALGRVINDFHSYSSGGRLNLAGRGMATIVLCEQPDVHKIVRYMRAGALTVLPTPLEPDSLSRWIVDAIEIDRQRLRDERRLEQMRSVYNGLAERKRCVLQHMIDGKASKWSAHDLDVSRRTIELDRAEILQAFGVSNAIELARLVTETKCLPLDFTHPSDISTNSLALAK